MSCRRSRLTASLVTTISISLRAGSFPRRRIRQREALGDSPTTFCWPTYDRVNEPRQPADTCDLRIRE
jgi:hypothetical protein